MGEGEVERQAAVMSGKPRQQHENTKQSFTILSPAILHNLCPRWVAECILCRLVNWAQRADMIAYLRPLRV